MGKRAFQVMGAGYSAGHAIAINGSMNTTVSAAGTTQATATAIGAGNSFISTAAASSGVVLPQGQPGDEFDIYNGGANAVTVYPPTGAKINGLGTNSGMTLGTNSECHYKQWSTTQFTANLSA